MRREEQGGQEVMYVMWCMLTVYAVVGGRLVERLGRVSLRMGTTLGGVGGRAWQRQRR